MLPAGHSPAARTGRETRRARRVYCPIMSGAERQSSGLAVFCDFDGTFSVQDVGSTIARDHLADRRARLWAEYEAGKQTAWEYNVRLFEGFALPEDELQRFLETIELSAGAHELVAWCDARKAPFRILSDGFDYNLDHLQQIHDVRFEYTSNHLRYVDGCWEITPGHPDPSCGCGTGTCKRSVIGAWRESNPGAVCVHIGNGRVSDACGAIAADFAFAKDTLAEELEQRGAEFERFRDLNDVVAGLDARFTAPS
jgi:2-hydroxy-3-keto-5-methylthiopentenyl-1-phosphate phosphatase